MRIVLGYRTLSSFAGSETYLLTVAEQLQSLGHEVWCFAHELGQVAEVAKERGIRVASPDELPGACDAVLAQDGAMAYELAERYPAATRVFVAHSTEFLGQAPPQLPDVCDAVVAMNDRVGRYLDGMATRPELVRLRQPVDLVRFSRWSQVRERPRRVLGFGNEHGGPRWRVVEDVCAELGLEVELVGRHGRVSAAPERDIAGADVVIGIGRCVLEAMACGKAAYVNGVVGGDGWVTPETYPALEADGFSGRAFDAQVDAARLRADLADWRPELGQRGKELAWLHHDATQHAVALVELWQRLGARSRTAPSGGEELARLVRVQAQAENRVIAHSADSADQRRRAKELEAELLALKATRRWRLAGALAAPLERLRALRNRRDHRRTRP